MPRPPSDLAAPLVLTANVAEIHQRLIAGQTIDQVTLVGTWRGSWSRRDVMRVAAVFATRPRDREPRSAPAPVKPPRELRPCGTRAAYRRHHRHGEPACEKCRRAERERQVEYELRRAAKAS
jgi:hypothetical protein